MKQPLLRACLIAGLALVGAAPAAHAQSSIAILDATGVSILDTSNGQQQARFALPLQTGETPKALAASADGARLFVTTTFTTSYTGALLVLDRDTGATVARFPTSNSTVIGRVAPTSDGKQVYFAATVKPPDGYSATYNNYCDVYKVDVEVGTLALVSGTHTSGKCVQTLLSPNADRLYLSVTQALCCGSGGATGSVVAFALNPSGATALWADGGFPANDPLLALTTDGGTLFGRFYWFHGPADYGVRVYDIVSGSYVSHRLPMAYGPMAAVSNTRFFVSGTSFFGPRTSLADTSTDTVLGETLVYGTLVSDSFAARTYVLEAARLSRLDNDTAAATTVATGTGWLDGAVLKDPCLTVTLSPALFTTDAASGTATITAPGSCSWTIDPSTVPGLSFTTTSGSGPASLPFTLASRSAPSRDTFKVGRRSLTIERVQPLMHIDEPGPVAQQPFQVRGWAIEVSVNPSTIAPPAATVSTVHVWAWPMPSGAPVFLGAVPASGNRSDIASAFGPAYAASEFSVPVSGLATGTYAIVAYAQSARLGTFTQQNGVLVSVLSGTRVAIDEPGPSVPRTFKVRGWAVDSGAVTGPGIDAVHVWAFPDSGAAPIWVGAADYGSPRDDIAAIYGPTFRNSGYVLYASLPPGRYSLQVFARSTVTGEFTAATAPLTVVPDSTPEMNIDEPAPSSTISGTFQVRGWAIDRGAASGTGIDAFHIWAFPTDGSAARFVGVGSPTTRPDISALFGPQFAESGFLLTGASLPPGSYTLAVFGHSTVTNSFSVIRVVTITVQ
jgi:hypothetical protein